MSAVFTEPASGYMVRAELVEGDWVFELFHRDLDGFSRLGVFKTYEDAIAELSIYTGSTR